MDLITFVLDPIWNQEPLWRDASIAMELSFCHPTVTVVTFKHCVVHSILFAALADPSIKLDLAVDRACRPQSLIARATRWIAMAVAIPASIGLHMVMAHGDFRPYAATWDATFRALAIQAFPSDCAWVLNLGSEGPDLMILPFFFIVAMWAASKCVIVPNMVWQLC